MMSTFTAFVFIIREDMNEDPLVFCILVISFFIFSPVGEKMHHSMTI